MTTTTEPTTTTPDIPAWLNLDGFCPAETRQKLNEAADALEGLIAHAEPVFRQAFEAGTLYDRTRSRCALDGIDMELGHLTGYTRFRDAIETLDALVCVAGGDRGAVEKELIPEWATPTLDSVPDVALYVSASGRPVEGDR